MTNRKDLRIDRLAEVLEANVRTDGYVPFVFITNVGEIVYQINASNQASQLDYLDSDVRFQLLDAPQAILEIELSSREHPYISRVELRNVPPLGWQTPPIASPALIVPLLPVIDLSSFKAPTRRDDPLIVSVVREVRLEDLPDYYRISWERFSPTTIFDGGAVRWGSVGPTIVCLDIRKAGLALTDAFEERIQAGPQIYWKPAVVSELYLKYLDRG